MGTWFEGVGKGPGALRGRIGVTRSRRVRQEGGTVFFAEGHLQPGLPGRASTRSLRRNRNDSVPFRQDAGGCTPGDRLGVKKFSARTLNRVGKRVAHSL